MKHVKALTALLFANAISLFSATVDDEKMPISFDQAFPSSWYTKALDVCMQVWADLEGLRASRDTIFPEDRELLLHAAVGRMVYAATCLEQMCVDKNQAIPADDLLYLIRIADRIEERSRSVLSGDNEHTLCFKRMLGQLRQKLKLLITKKSS